MRHRPARLPVLAAALLVGAVAGCSRFPALDDTVSDSARTAPYPDLVPVGMLLAQVPPDRIAPDTDDASKARAARLRARAAALRGTVIDTHTSARMGRGIQ